MNLTEQNRTVLGHDLYTIRAIPGDKNHPVRANVLLVHGLGEHCRRYDEIIETFTRHQIAVTTYDHIGHGRSAGKRGVTRYSTEWEIMKALRDEMITADPDIPFFLYGHSMGGGLVLAFAQQFPERIRGVVATSPALGTGSPYPAPVVWLAGFFGKLFPSLTISNGLPAENLYQAEAQTGAYKKDPLNHDQIALALAYDLMTIGATLTKMPEPFPVPLLLLQGDADRCVSPAHTTQFATKPGNEAVEYHLYPGAFHELHREPIKDEVIETMWRWILAKAGNRSQ